MNNLTLQHQVSTTQQTAAIIAYLMLLSRSDHHIDSSKDMEDRKDTLGYEAMVNWIFLSRSRVQTAKNDQKIDRRLCWFRQCFSHLQEDARIEMAAKTERTWYRPNVENRWLWQWKPRLYLSRNRRPWWRVRNKQISHQTPDHPLFQQFGKT